MTTSNTLINAEYLKIQNTASNIIDAVRMANELDVDNTEKAEARIQVYLSVWNQKDIKDLVIWTLNIESYLEYRLKSFDASSEDAQKITLEIQDVKDLREKVNEARIYLPEIVW